MNHEDENCCSPRRPLEAVLMIKHSFLTFRDAIRIVKQGRTKLNVGRSLDWTMDLKMECERIIRLEQAKATTTSCPSSSSNMAASSSSSGGGPSSTTNTTKTDAMSKILLLRNKSHEEERTRQNNEMTSSSGSGIVTDSEKNTTESSNVNETTEAVVEAIEESAGSMGDNKERRSPRFDGPEWSVTERSDDDFAFKDIAKSDEENKVELEKTTLSPRACGSNKKETDNSDHPLLDEEESHRTVNNEQEKDSEDSLLDEEETSPPETKHDACNIKSQSLLCNKVKNVMPPLHPAKIRMDEEQTDATAVDSTAMTTIASGVPAVIYVRIRGPGPGVVGGGLPPLPQQQAAAAAVGGQHRRRSFLVRLKQTWQSSRSRGALSVGRQPNLVGI